MSADDLQLGKIWYQPPPGSLRWAHPSRWTEGDWWHWCRQGPSPMSADEFATYWYDRQRWGVGIRDVDKKGRPTSAIRWLYNPTPKGVLFHACEAPFLLWGGARGGGKSEALRWDAYARCLQQPGYRAIIFRRLHEELKLHHVDRARREIKAITNNHPDARVIGDDECVFPNGSLIKFGHCKDPGSEEKYLGSEWPWIGLDQMESFLPSQIVDIMGSGRTAEEGMTSVVRGTANPGGPDPQWIIDRFIDKNPPEDDRLTYDPKEWVYIPAAVVNNPWLMDPDGSFSRYEGRLAQYSPIRRRQMLLGDWKAREGQFFPELTPEHQAELEIPAGTRWILGLDFGTLRPGCVVWVAVFPDGRLYVRHEFKFMGRQLYAAPRAHGESQANYAGRAKESVAYRIHEINERYGIKPYSLVCDPDLDNNKTGGETGVAGLRRVGLPAIAGDNARLLGWLRLRQWMARAPDGRPWMLFHPEAKYVWRSMTTVVSDPNEPDDVLTSCDDHGADALRYVIFSRPSPDNREAGRTKYPAGSIGDMIKKSQGKRGAGRIL